MKDYFIIIEYLPCTAIIIVNSRIVQEMSNGVQERITLSIIIVKHGCHLEGVSNSCVSHDKTGFITVRSI